MSRGGRLKAALDAEKGIDYKLQRQKKLQRLAAKKKSIRSKSDVREDKSDPENQEDTSNDETGGVSLGKDFDISQVDDTASSDASSESEKRSDDVIEGWQLKPDQESKFNRREEESNKTSEDEDENEHQLADTNGVPLPLHDQNDNHVEDEPEDIPFSDIASLDSEERGDVVPFQRLTINNHTALAASLSRISLPTADVPFSTLQSITSASAIIIDDVNNDLNRELAFYAQSLSAIKEAKKRLKAEGVPFTRPSDYFAEMVKSEEHMGRVKQRLVDDAAGKKAASEARKQRDLKKFGKAVQVAKQQERDKAKRETLDKINVLKRKRSNALPANENEPDMFDITLENETKRPRLASSGAKTSTKTTNFKRQSKNDKYGFGGKKKYLKSGDAMSSAGIGLKGKSGAKKRLGKSRRAKAHS